jgi:pimeloyl-ACP methyl ester carboxylesterase
VPYLERTGGARLYYELHGPDRAPPVLLLEGYGGDIPGWGSTVDHLAQHARVIAYDFRGNGRSIAPDPSPTLATFVEDTVALMDHLRIDRADLYGQSFGGMVAQVLAVRYPARVRSLILAATHCGGPKRRLGRIKVPKDQSYVALFSEAFVLNHPDRVDERRKLLAQGPQSLKAAKPQYEAIRGFDICDRLADLRVPALILHGTGDRMVPSANAHVLAERIPGARLILLEGAGHLYHWEQPEAANRAVLEFLRDVHEDDGQP